MKLEHNLLVKLQSWKSKSKSLIQSIASLILFFKITVTGEMVVSPILLKLCCLWTYRGNWTRLLRTVFPAVNVSGENPSLSEHLWIIKHQLFFVPREVSGITTLNTLCWPPKKCFKPIFGGRKPLKDLSWYLCSSLFSYLIHKIIQSLI